MAKFSVAQMAIDTGTDSNSRSQSGMPVASSALTTVQLVSAPTISTSPCAKLIRLMMP